jgi:hypothetical protein
MKEPSYNEIKHIERALEMLRRNDPRNREAWLKWLMDNVDGYAENAMRCSRCDVPDKPLTMIEGGSTPEYACPECYASDYVDGWTGHWESQAEARKAAREGN